MSYIAFRGAVFVIYGSFFYLGIKKTTLRAVVLFCAHYAHFTMARDRTPPYSRILLVLLLVLR